MPAPKPNARASALAVEKPSFIAWRCSGYRAGVDHVDVDGLIGEVGLKPAALRVDDDVHLGLIGRDHRAADGFSIDSYAFEVLLEDREASPAR